MKVLSLICYVLLLCSCSLSAQSDYAKGAQDSAIIKEYYALLDVFKQGNEKKNIKKLKKMAADRPGFVQVQMLLGYYFQEKGDYETAITYFSNAIVADRKTAMAYFNRGNCYLAQKRFNLATADYNQTLRFDSLNYAAYNNLAVSRLLNQGGGKINSSELEVAKQDIKKLEERAGLNELPVIMNLGLIYFHLFDFKNALPYFNQALNLDTSSGKADYYAGLCHYYLREFPESRSLLLDAFNKGYNRDNAKIFIDFIDYIFAQMTNSGKQEIKKE